MPYFVIAVATFVNVCKTSLCSSISYKAKWLFILLDVQCCFICLIVKRCATQIPRLHHMEEIDRFTSPQFVKALAWRVHLDNTKIHTYTHAYTLTLSVSVYCSTDGSFHSSNAALYVVLFLISLWRPVWLLSPWWCSTNNKICWGFSPRYFILPYSRAG